MIIQHNMAAVHTMEQLGITNINSRKATERLSSGYRINRAADDVAVLAISEKKRAQIRGLRRAAKNAEDAVSLVQTGDGAMGSIEDLLQRMRELTVQALNDAVYEPEDQAALQMEFDELQSEIDRINDQTEFNSKPVFEHYPKTFFSFKGNRVWSQDQVHTIDASNQSIDLKYRVSETEPEKTITLTIPEGRYTTQQLIDEMDDVVMALGDAADGLYLEYTDENTCNMVLRNGEKISEVAGGLSYLFFDEHEGSKVGSLIGTTEFAPGFPLEINEKNNELKFTIEYFDGTERDMDIHIKAGRYTREEMIDYLNRELAGTGMEADTYGDFSIQVGGEEGIITGLKGNMFKIDEKGVEKVMVSVFYDNMKYGNVKKTAAEFTGGAVLVTRSSDTECGKFQITDENDTLRLRVGDETAAFEEIVLDHKDYTMPEMVEELQKKMSAKGLDVRVESCRPRESTIYSPNGHSYYFQAIRLISGEKGKRIGIEFDQEKSTAYDTLFITRKYTDEGRGIETTSGKDEYTSPYLTGGKIAGTDNLPLTITAGNNDSFSLRLTEQAGGTVTQNNYTVKLTPGRTYGTIDDILTEINEKLNGADAPIGIKGKIQAVNAEGAIQFKAADGSRTVTSIEFAETSSAGYQNLFVGKTTVYSTSTITSSGTPPTLPLDKLSDPTVIDGSNDKLAVNVGGESREVDIPHGTYTPDKLAEILTEKLKGKESTDTNNYKGSGTGESKMIPSKYEVTGGESISASIVCDVKGSGRPKDDGTTEEYDTKPAVYTVPVRLGAVTNIGDSNDLFTIRVNDADYNITLDHGDFSPAEIAAQFHNKLDAAIHSSSDKVNVTLDDAGRLKFTTEQANSYVHMSFDTGTSSFMDTLRKRFSPAEVTTKAVKSSITIDGTHDLFSIEIDGNPYTATLDHGTFSREVFAGKLEEKLRALGAGVSVKAKGSALYFVTDEEGKKASIELNTGDCGTAAEALFGDQMSKTAATAKLDTPLPGTTSAVVKKSEEGEFKVKLTEGGVTREEELTLPARDGGYSSSQIRSQLQGQLNTLGMNVTVSLDSYGYLSFTSGARGTDVSLSVEGTTSTVRKTPDIEASVDPSGKLVLKNTSNGATISMTPGSGSAVLKPIPVPTVYRPSSPIDGSVRQVNYELRTNRNVKIPSTIKISDYNKEWNFSCVTPGGMKDLSITFDEDEYSGDRLKEIIQKKLDDELGPGQFCVDISDGKMSVTAEHCGNAYRLTNLTGGFYEYVMQGKAVRGSKEEEHYTGGKQMMTDTYIAGRKDVRNKTSEIKKGVNDSLSIDVTINRKTYTLEMTLDPGNYSAEALTDHLQHKLDEYLKTAGYPELPEHSILAGVGVFDTNVVGADDKNALFFYLNKDMEPEEGEYRIDGLGGTSLFEIFYKTEGDLVPSYITGTKDISAGVEIPKEENKFSIEVDGIRYDYEIPEGTYTCKEFVDKMNEVLQVPDANLNASLSGNALKISYDRVGPHKVRDISGAAKTVMFYDTAGRKADSVDDWIQLGANIGEGVSLQRFSMSTISMGINSLVISGNKYANKALVRLDEALSYLNAKRSLYGAKQNRFEYTIKGNDNTSENLQASESRDRDADMAEEVVRFSKSKILQQTGNAVLTQANQHAERVLSLVRLG